MKTRILAALGLCIALGAAGRAQAQAAATPVQETAMTTRATGPFEVKMAPLGTHADPPVLGRMSLDKVYHGDLEATAAGEMLAAMTPTEGSAGYVAIERVTGTLAGRTGTFMLQHNGLMNRGAPSLVINVVPDSGTGGLEGLAGTMNIVITDGRHTYEFDYTLPASN
ncbi:MAG TPA: DUF3224 domain-containing protein [Longimicrobium sp.]|nr:DUF3224 domain-containing protein [Longimicrobium sp.]